MRRYGGVLSFLALLSLAGVALTGACGQGGTGGSGAGSTLCDPGENIFCRCPGGDPGTKRCKEDGQSFEGCVTRNGPCPAIPMSTSSSSSTSGGGSGGGTGGGTVGALYDPCLTGDDCASGLCPYGYCTIQCAKFDECGLGQGECAALDNQQICMPVCKDTADCEAAYGPPSECGYTHAVDGFPVTTCADWLDNLDLPPEGTNCTIDDDCHLGHDHTERVCAFEACAQGCYVDADCPVGQTCSSQGALGSCQ